MHQLFQVHRLNDPGQEKAGRITKAFDELMTLLAVEIGEDITPAKVRSFGLAQIHLEEACMHAKKALSLDPQNQKWNKRLPQQEAKGVIDENRD